jgi:arylformamidase
MWSHNGLGKARDMKIYDISRLLTEALPVWPGDEPFHYVMNSRIEDGATVNLGSISLSVHSGTHADAPFHSSDNGATIEQIDVSTYIGPAVLVDVSGLRTIEVKDLAIDGLRITPRLLLRTGSWTDPSRFPTQFPVIAEGVADYLQSQGVVLLGVDVPSVDLFDSKELPNHHALNARGIQILESLSLAGVPAGSYELIALPLKLDGADGSPVRAILRTLVSD